ncbi:MAG: hypothetical protein GQ564_01180 [Bacteroidales bacterium]|nr:hypothetical protein [Bacteroidales bacterium]
MFNKIALTFLLLSSSLLIFPNSLTSYTIIDDYMTKFDRIDQKDGLSNNMCNVVYQDKYGFIWIGTQNGLNRFDGYKLVQYLHLPKDSLTISGNFISDICEDIYGNLWVSTHNGLNIFNRKNESFTHYFKSKNKNSLKDNHVRALHPDSSGNIWIETLDGTLSKLDISIQKFYHYSHSKITQAFYKYHDIFEDKNNNIWIGGRNLGPCYFNQTTESFTYIKNDPFTIGKKRDKDVACYFIDNENDFWISATDGVYLFYPDKEYFEKFLGSSTYSIIQDKEGFIWFGSGSGAYRYDKKRNEMTHYVNDENNINSISENHINDIIEDRSGNIWFATDNGISKLNKSINKFGHLYHIPENENSLASNKISDIISDDNENLWIGYVNKGFDKYDLKNQSFTHFRENKEKGLRSDYVSKLYFDKNQTLWIGLWRGVGFNSFDTKTNSFKQFAYDPTTRKRDWYSDFEEDENNNFWIGIWGSKGLHQFNREKGEFNGTNYRPLNEPLEASLNSVNYNKNKSVWVCNNYNKIYRYDLKSNVFFGYVHSNNPISENKESYSNKVFYTQLFPFKHVLGSINTSDGNEIIITNKGIIKYDYSKDKFEIFESKKYEITKYSHFIDQHKLLLISKSKILSFNLNTFRFSIMTEFNEFNTDSITNIIELDKQNVIICTFKKIIHFDTLSLIKKTLYSTSENEQIFNSFLNLNNEIWISTNKGLSIYNLTDGSTNNSLLEEFQNIEIFDLLIDSSENTWAGTNNGLYKIGKKQILKHYTSDNSNSIVSNKVYSLSIDDNQNLWIGTEKGLCKKNIENDSFQSFNQPSDESLNSHLTSDLFEDSKGNLWIGTTNKGLNKLNQKTGKIKHFAFNEDDTLSISSNNISCIFEDNMHCIWVGTTNGLNLLNKSGSFKRFNLSDRAVFSIIQDDNGFLWISTDNGLVKFNCSELTYENFYESDGLQGNKFSKGACNLQNGLLAFGGEYGINIFDPNIIMKSSINPEIQITAFKVFNKVVKNDFTQTNEINLKYDNNFFTIYFSTLNYNKSYNQQYLYKLNKINPNWVPVENEAKASYTDIKPGRYIFQVKSVLKNGKESKAINLNITIYPPYWKTWWFYTFEIILILSIILWIAHLGLKKYRIEKENLELEQKLLRSQMNPHFIFNALISIQNFIYSNDTQNADKFLTKFSRLLRLILQNSRTKFITIDDEVQTISNYLDLQKLRFEDKFDFSINIDSAINTEDILIPPMLAQPFIENSIEHGFIEKSEKYNLNIEIKYSKSNLVYIIEDNGIGIKKSIELKKSIDSVNKSLGMQITKERILNLKNTQKQNIKLKIEDLSTLNSNKQGTKITLTLHVKK